MAFGVSKGSEEVEDLNPGDDVSSSAHSAQDGPVKDWPGHSLPGHIRPIGPTYRQQPSANDEPDQSK